jgi:hypothetical protein
MENVKQGFFVKNKKPIIGITAGVAILGTASYFVFFYKDEDGFTLMNKWRGAGRGSGGTTGSGTSGGGTTGGGAGKCPAGETYNAVTKKCCHPTINRVGCPRAGMGKGTLADILAERG